MGETGVSAVLCASHRDPLSGLLHGHTWQITVWTSATPRRDARVMQERLVNICRAWDHTTLPDELAGGEDIAEAVARLLGDCTEVIVSRPLEGLFARWRP